MREKHPLRVVVLSAGSEPEMREAAEVVGLALAESGAAGEDEPSPEERRSSRPSYEPLEAADALVEHADAVVALDAESLERARERGTSMCVAVLPWFDVGWGGELGQADLVLVAHAAVADELVTRGVRRDRIAIVGTPLPATYAPPEDRAAARRDAGIPEDTSTVLVPTNAIDADDRSRLLIQLSMVKAPVTWLFDVGEDVELAEQLRRLIPAHELRAKMFAAGPDAGECWALADVVLGRLRGPEATRALAVGALLVIVDPQRRPMPAVGRALVESGVAAWLESPATLAIEIERCLDPVVLSRARASAARELLRATAFSMGRAVRDAYARRFDRAVRRGLPVGLETLYDPESPVPPTGPPRTTPPPPRVPGGELDPSVTLPGPAAASSSVRRETDEEVVERELAALKERLKS